MERTNSNNLFEIAKNFIPGGVNSPVRAFGSVDKAPIFVEKGEGAYLYDVDGNKYIDFISSWGPLIFGHSDSEMRSAFIEALDKGVTYGLPSAIEVEMAKEISDAYPACEMVRMVNSGTEATMSAIRTARGYTGKDKFIKFEGCYHGHSDCLLVKSGSGTLTYNAPTSLGVPKDVIKDTIVCEFNSIESVQNAIDENKGEIAAVIIEPVPGNMGVVPPTQKFMEDLRELTKKEGIILIFDEVITGFRLAYGGASETFNIKPDMVCFGKIIGGGLPVGAYGGRKDIMSIVSPLGGVYQAGTLSGNPLAMYLGLKTLRRLRDNKDIYTDLERKAKRLEEGFKKNISDLGLEITVNRYRSMISMFFTGGPIDSYKDVQRADNEMYGIYFREMLKRNILLAPAQFEAMFMNTVLTDEHLDYTIKSHKEALVEINS
ncbi:glutamate-1-semialdehyde 2,1-aminomutase [Acetoanaerobium pronyense]|uniref:Glutamate-1-semialdehyde 2,1-aminomutase n=1 Tax=Acetoanaerobium pronyense TaxID=1482736 RepID=A0ABS4KIW2_9FIRM|nr:glutamate-1-semialdehyde 2,1-aminomutase [Acetoanaerobium pronyense]MBP2027699.1 glutamate-1-semialdehyde 2,1-aminomutase [Acetoanaerobium pronyense]